MATASKVRSNLNAALVRAWNEDRWYAGWLGTSLDRSPCGDFCGIVGRAFGMHSEDDRDVLAATLKCLYSVETQEVEGLAWLDYSTGKWHEVPGDYAKKFVLPGLNLTEDDICRVYHGVEGQTHGYSPVMFLSDVFTEVFENNI